MAAACVFAAAVGDTPSPVGGGETSSGLLLGSITPFKARAYSVGDSVDLIMVGG